MNNKILKKTRKSLYKPTSSSPLSLALLPLSLSLNPEMDPKTNIRLPRGYILSGKLMLTAIIVLFSLVLLLLFLHLFLRFLRRRRRRNSLTLTASGDRAPAPRGLDPAVLSSLSISLFSAADLDADDVGECAVCLSEFEEGEKVRVLPRCDHRFHAACVDVWFGSNSSCPLCRSPVEIESPAAAAEEEMASPAEQCGDLEVGSSSSVEIGRREEALGLGLGFGFALVLVMKKLWFGGLRREGDLERGGRSRREGPTICGGVVEAAGEAEELWWSCGCGDRV